MTPEQVKESRKLIERAYRVNAKMLAGDLPYAAVFNDTIGLAEHLLDDAIVRKRKDASND